MIRTFQYKVYRNKRVENRFKHWLSTCRYVYNTAKEVRDTAFKSGVKVSHYDLCKQLTEAKKDVDFLRKVGAQTLQCTLDQLESGYQSFFRKHKSGEIAKMKARYISKKEKRGEKADSRVVFRIGKPNWAKKGRFNSFGFKQTGRKGGLPGLRQVKKGFRLPGFGVVKVHNNRIIDGKIKTARLVEKSDGIYLNVVAEINDSLKTPTKNQVGIDMGIAFFMVTSDGEYVANPRFLEKKLPDLRRAQRSLSRKTKGSSRRASQKKVVSQLHLSVANSRKDFLHKESTRICQENTLIVRENLRVSSMIRSSLSRHISDVSWSLFFTMLDYKAAEVVKINPAYTSQECSKCGDIDRASRVSQSVYCCASCGHTENADKNAAKNILGRAFPDDREREPLGCALVVTSRAK